MSLGVLTTTMSVSDSSRTIIVSKEQTTRLHQFGLVSIEGKNLFIYIPYIPLVALHKLFIYIYAGPWMIKLIIYNFVTDDLIL